MYTDVWASMGEEEQIPERIKLLKAFQINRGLFDKTGNAECTFLHCLPAFHNTETKLAKQFPDICEVSDEIFESRQFTGFQPGREPRPYDQGRDGGDAWQIAGRKGPGLPARKTGFLTRRWP